jgi:hypothetical protein
VALPVPGDITHVMAVSEVHDTVWHAVLKLSAPSYEAFKLAPCRTLFARAGLPEPQPGITYQANKNDTRVALSALLKPTTYGAIARTWWAAACGVAQEEIGVEAAARGALEGPELLAEEGGNGAARGGVRCLRDRSHSGRVEREGSVQHVHLPPSTAPSASGPAPHHHRSISVSVRSVSTPRGRVRCTALRRLRGHMLRGSPVLL